MNRRYPKSLFLVGLCAALAIVWVAPAQAETRIFGYTGGEQIFTVPSGVTSIGVVAFGGSGGDSDTAPGGLGALVTGDLAVTPGQTLYIIVGGDGETESEGGGGGFNGGGDGEGSGQDAGGGGGATDIRTTPLAAGLGTDTRLVVAAGGGGGGGSSATDSGGAGGEPGEDGERGGPLDMGLPIGAPGGEAGGNSAGGEGGEGCEQPGGEGAGGFLAFGGDGGDTTTSGTAGPGGGGGGGLYGGGGGGGACNFGSGGGGGGSSLLPPGGEEFSGLFEDFPLVELVYEIPPAPPAPAPTTTPPVPVPNTILGARPGKTIRTSKKKVKVRFAFSSDVAGATFQCKLDKGRFARCTSPKAYRLGPGKHNFSVRAVGPGGTDPSPAKLRFRIRKTK